LFVSCILKSVVLSVSHVSPVHDILFDSCLLKSVVQTTDFNIQLPNNISCTGDTGDTGRTTA
jgi:hypothetical protein